MGNIKAQVQGGALAGGLPESGKHVGFQIEHIFNKNLNVRVFCRKGAKVPQIRVKPVLTV